MSDKDLLYEVAKLAQFDACESIWWRWNEGRTELLVLVNCSDLFDWGTADCELVTEENLPILKQSIADVQVVSGSEYDGQSTAFLLFCCRVRKQRPQGAYYKYLTVHYSVPDGLNEWGNPKQRKDEEESALRTENLRDLFNACGPQRGIDFLNPKDQEGNYQYKPDGDK
ncbi:hypothetical protein [Mycobacteroides abscessus]|uniref:hypothetical protein n=1 Tax=Mycobacteroides abscessus TaxID=36809 RepID=UPI00031C0606|nr:hypothetical protein [Mycobacteroides abscessus]